MSTTSRQSSTSSQTRAGPMQDDHLKAADKAAGGAGSAEPRAAAADSGTAEKGARGQRDGDGVLEEDGVEIVGLTGDDDPYSPLNYSTARKWIIVIIVSLGSACVTCASSAVTLTYAGTEAEFGSSSEVTILGLSLFVLGLGIGPLFLGPMSEFYGRRPIYILAFAFFIAFNFLVAFAPKIAGWILGRFFCGVAGSAFLSVAGGTVTDVFRPHQVGAPMGVYTSSPFLGPVLGPIISGFINQHLDWRWTWRVFLCWSGAELALIIFLVPETFLPRLLKVKAKKLRKAGRPNVQSPMDLDQRSIPQVILKSCTTPFAIGATEPMALVLCTWTALLLGILYLFFSAFGRVYEAYGFSTQEVGLTFIGLGIGIVGGTCAHPIWAGYYRRVTEATGQRPPPEEHLRKGLYGAVLCPLSLFWFAWTTANYVSTPWPSLVATIPFGLGLVWSFQAVFVYLVDAYRPVAASAMSLNSAMRSTFACIFPLFSPYMFDRLGNAWALTLCAFLLLAIVPFPFLFFKYGHKYRSNSKFTNTA